LRFGARALAGSESCADNALNFHYKVLDAPAGRRLPDCEKIL
jgi:hypothetical protein